MSGKKLLPARSAHCTSHGGPFEQGSGYISHLYLKDEEWVRADYCPKCWEKVAEEKVEGHHWRGSIPIKVKKPLSPDEKALSLFQTLKEMPQKNPLHLYFLTLYLERKRQLIRHVKGKKEWICEVPQTGETFALTQTPFSPQEGEEATRELATLLDT